MNSDPEVMAHFPTPLDRAGSDAMVDRIEATFERRGLGLWAVEVGDGADFAGFIGLWPAEFDAPFTPAIEIGWRLARPFWGRGYATEGALAVLADGFGRLGLDRIVSFTATSNERSWRVMERIGLRHQPEDDFDHPNVAEGHPLRPHLLYRADAATWRPPDPRT